MKSKTNPRRRPATMADVEAAWRQGVIDGCNNACALFLSVIADKFDMAEQLPAVWADINKLSGEIVEGRLTFADLRHTLNVEYNILI